jgi:hypothetical protein
MYYPTGQVWDIPIQKQLDIYNIFKDNLTSKFLELQIVPEEVDTSIIDRPTNLPTEIIIADRKRKFSDLDQIELSE